VGWGEEEAAPEMDAAPCRVPSGAWGRGTMIKRREQEYVLSARIGALGNL
jgi:hypothetical protein